jgi:hypothetical protein
MSEGKRIDTLPVRTLAAPTDRVMVYYNAANSFTAQTATITVANLLGNSGGFPLYPDPANSTSIMVQAGTLFFSNSHGYYAVADNKLKRFLLSDF